MGTYLTHKDGVKRLNCYVTAGHVIASHSYSHPKLSATSTGEFINDIKKEHEVLSKFPNFKPYFRFPHLCEGNTKEKRQAIIRVLREMGYPKGYITVHNHVYRLNQLFLFLNATKEKNIDYTKLIKLYSSIL